MLQGIKYTNPIPLIIWYLLLLLPMIIIIITEKKVYSNNTGLTNMQFHVAHLSCSSLPPRGGILALPEVNVNEKVRN